MSRSDSLEQLTIAELPSRTAGRDHYKRDNTLCISLHVALVLLYAALFAIYSHHYEHSITMPLNAFSTTVAPFVVGTVLQLFSTVSGTTQRLPPGTHLTDCRARHTLRS